MRFKVEARVGPCLRSAQGVGCRHVAITWTHTGGAGSVEGPALASPRASRLDSSVPCAAPPGKVDREGPSLLGARLHNGAELLARSMQAARDGLDRAVEHDADLLVAEALSFARQKHGPVSFGQALQGGLEGDLELAVLGGRDRDGAAISARPTAAATATPGPGLHRPRTLAARSSRSAATNRRRRAAPPGR